MQRGRDDVEPQLRCQQQVVDAIDREWVPYVEPESESEAETAFSSDSSDSGAVELVASADSLQGEGASEHCFSGPWLLNIRSGVFRKAIRNVQEDSHMLACRPQTGLRDGYELRRRNPRLLMSPQRWLQ